MHTIFTHNWEILKGERIPRWPSQTGEPRPVTIEISSWKGISFGAKHVNLRVEEAKNQWWCEDENAWVQISCDSEADGRSMTAAVYTQEEAKQLAVFFIKHVMKATPQTTVIEEDYHDYLDGIRKAVFGSKKA